MAERLEVRVIPNASRDEILGWSEGHLRVKIQAVPEGGRANQALVRFMAKVLDCRHRDIHLVSGETSRLKILDLPSGGLDLLRGLDKRS